MSPYYQQILSGPGDTVDWPNNVTLEREPDESEPAPVGAAARVRGRRGVAHAE